MLNTRHAKELIKESILKLMQTTDADRITAVDLAREAGISRATLYRYYDSVDDVLRDLEGEFMTGISEVNSKHASVPFDARCREKCHPSFVAITEYIHAHREVYLTMTGPHGSPRFVHYWHRFVQHVFLSKLAQESMSKKDLEVYMEFVLAGCDAVIRYWLEKRPDARPEESALVTQQILCGPFI